MLLNARQTPLPAGGGPVFDYSLRLKNQKPVRRSRKHELLLGDCLAPYICIALTG